MIRADVWTDAWMGRHESVYSLIWKYAYVNLLEGPTFMVRFGASLASAGAARGRSGMTLPFQKDLVHRDPQHRFAPHAGILMAARRIRICLKCIRVGYMSVFHQAAFVDRCAIHSSRLISNCPKCLQAFPSPGDFAKWMRNPFHCPTCGHYLGGDTFQARRLFEVRDSVFAVEDRFDGLAAWLQRLCDRRLPALQALGRGPKQEPPPEGIKRELLGWVLRAIEPTGLPKRVLAGKPGDLTALPFRDEAIPTALESEEFLRYERERVRIYRAIRRRLRRQISRQPGMGRHKQLLREVHRSRLDVAPETIAAFVRWRLCFEDVFEKGRSGPHGNLMRLSCYADPLYTAEGRAAPLGVWARFALSAVHAVRRSQGQGARLLTQRTVAARWATPLARRLSILPNGADGWLLVHFRDALPDNEQAAAAS